MIALKCTEAEVFSSLRIPKKGIVESMIDPCFNG